MLKHLSIGIAIGFVVAVVIYTWPTPRPTEHQYLGIIQDGYFGSGPTPDPDRLHAVYPKR